jgi:phosphate-selective porin OprO/OprP
MTGAPQSADADLRARIERLERQNQELMRALQSTSTQGGGEAAGAGGGVGKDEVQKIVSDYLASREAAKKQEESAKKAADEADGYRVGSLMNVTAKFNDYGYLWLTTPNKDFSMHIGSWVHYDNVFFDQSGGLRVIPGARPGRAQGVASGVAAGGIGDLEDGTYFRRIRPFVEGTLWETGEYRLNLALENDQFSTSGLDEFWVGLNKIPVIGTIRIGHVKTPMGLEGDMTASSRAMTFMERSMYSEAIELNQNFVTGIWFGNAFGQDQRVSYQAAIFRSDLGASSGVFFGDGQWGAQARLTCLPLWDCQGRQFLHLGMSGGWRNGTNNIATSPFRLFQLRARDELRDDDPAAGPAGSQTVPNSNDNRMIDTGSIAASNDFIAGLELLYVRGPFSIQAEYGLNYLSNAIGVAPTGTTFNPAITPGQNYTFHGGYVQLAYTLTGESRGYDKYIGTLNREYFSTPLYTNAWLVRDEHGRLNWGLGAWEIAARYSYTNLNDGTGLNRIQGGAMDGYTLGLNWYLNTNIKFQFDYVYNHRFEVPIGTFGGYVSGFGTRVQLSF